MVLHHTHTHTHTRTDCCISYLSCHVIDVFMMGMWLTIGNRTLVFTNLLSVFSAGEMRSAFLVATTLSRILLVLYTFSSKPYTLHMLSLVSVSFIGLRLMYHEIGGQLYWFWLLCDLLCVCFGFKRAYASLLSFGFISSSMSDVML
jgi:hypothetical protein